jgi:hypothetical protein
LTELSRALGLPSRARGGGKSQEQQFGAIIVVAIAVAVVDFLVVLLVSGPLIDPPEVAVVFSLVALRVSQSEAFGPSPRSSVAASPSLTASPSASTINSAASPLLSPQSSLPPLLYPPSWTNSGM